MTSGRMRIYFPTLRGFSVGDICAALVLGALAVVATWGAWVDIVSIAWRDEESSHVLLVPVVVAWVAWTRRARLRQCRPEGSWVALLGVVFGAVIWYVGFSQQKQMFWHAGAVILVTSCVLVGLGTEVFVRFLPVFGALVFLIPVPAHHRLALAIPLQDLTASVTQSVAEVFGMSMQRSGNMLSIHGVDVTVAEACNGMRMIFTLAMVCYAFAFTMPLRSLVRILILALSPVVSVVANVARLIPTVWAYGSFSRETADRVHDLSGWAMLILSFALLTGIVRLLRWAMVPVCRFNLSLA